MTRSAQESIFPFGSTWFGLRVIRRNDLANKKTMTNTKNMTSSAQESIFPFGSTWFGIHFSTRERGILNIKQL